MTSGARGVLHRQHLMASPLGKASHHAMAHEVSDAVIDGSALEELPVESVKAQALEVACQEEFKKTKYLQFIENEVTLQSLGATLGELMSSQADSQTARQAAAESEGEAATSPTGQASSPADPTVVVQPKAPAKSPIGRASHSTSRRAIRTTSPSRRQFTKAFDELKDVARSLIHTVDNIVGSVLSGVGGTVNSILRNTLLPGFARLLGDVFIYQRDHNEIQKRIWEAIAKYEAKDGALPGWGRADRPINVLAHSLGGVVTFDAALNASDPLHIKHFVTFGSQPAFFHLIAKRESDGGPVPTDITHLPATIGDWTSFWEPMDLLAFLAGPFFFLHASTNSPRDIRVCVAEVLELDQSCFWTHSCYWTHQKVHEEIRKVLGKPVSSPITGD